jgi:hypothetical protein
VREVVFPSTLPLKGCRPQRASVSELFKYAAFSHLCRCVRLSGKEADGERAMAWFAEASVLLQNYFFLFLFVLLVDVCVRSEAYTSRFIIIIFFPPVTLSFSTFCLAISIYRFFFRLMLCTNKRCEIDTKEERRNTTVRGEGEEEGRCAESASFPPTSFRRPLFFFLSSSDAVVSDCVLHTHFFLLPDTQNNPFQNNFEIHRSRSLSARGRLPYFSVLQHRRKQEKRAEHKNNDSKALKNKR